MQVLAFGINHNTASVEIRERLNFNQAQLPQALQHLCTQANIDEAVIVSTCNRTELYCGTHTDDMLATDTVIRWLSQYQSMPINTLKHYLYTHSRQAAVQHLLRVACGLDSMILGEPQILGQIKTAYRTAQEANTTGRYLGRLFQHSFAVAKQVRTDTAIGSSPVSVAFAAVRLAQQIFGDLDKHTALLIGAGETIELTARHLKENNLGGMIVANRTLERAHNLATNMGAYAITLPEIDDHLAEADVVIASTGSPTTILSKAQVEAAMKKRKHRPMFIVDIAVPRDVDPKVSDLEDVFLYTVDDLNEVIQENMRSRQQAARQAEDIIETQVAHFLDWVQSLTALDTIKSLRNQAEDIKQNLLKQALNGLQTGKPATEVMQLLAHRLTNTLLHHPSVQLRQAGVNGKHDTVKLAQQLFQLDLNHPEGKK